MIEKLIERAYKKIDDENVKIVTIHCFDKNYLSVIITVTNHRIDFSYHLDIDNITEKYTLSKQSAELRINKCDTIEFKY